MIDHDPTFSLQGAIAKQVAHEDLVNWARRGDEPEPPEVAELPAQEWSAASLYVLGRGMIKRVPSLLLP